MAGEKIDEAYVEIKPDVDDFARDTQRELTSAFRQVENKLDDVVDSIDRSFDNLARQLDVLFDNLSFDIRQSLDEVADRAEGTALNMGAALEAGANSAERSIDDLADEATRDLSRIDRAARNTGRTVATSLIGAGAGAGAISQLSEVGAVLRNLAAIPLSLGGGLLSIAKFAAIAALIPIIIALTGALMDLIPLLLTLPAAFGVLAAIIAPLPIAFMGIGDAVKALVEGDFEKLNEALKKLTPSARSFVMEIRGILKPLRDIRTAVQEAFFGQLRGVLTDIGKFLLPVLRDGLAGVARVLGFVTAEFGRLLVANDILVALRNIMASAARVMQILGPAIVDAFGTLIGMVEGGLPFIERFATWLARILMSFGEWQREAMSSGRFMGWIETAIQTLKDLGTLTRSVFGFIGALAGDAGDEGRSFILVLAEMFDRMAAFFRSPEGREFLQDMLDGLKGVGQALMFFADLVRFAGMASNRFFDGITRMVIAFHLVRAALTNLITIVRTAITVFGEWVSGVGQRVVTFFTVTIPAMVGTAITFLTSLPGRIRDLATAAFDAMFFTIGFAIGTMIKNIVTLPDRIAAGFQAVFTRSLEVVRIGFDRIVAFFFGIPPRVGAAVMMLWNIVVGLFNQGVSNATTAVNTLPGRVWAAMNNTAARARSAAANVFNAAVDIGRGMIDGMINGIERGVGRLVDAAKRAAQRALDGAKRALGIASPSKEFMKLGGQSVEGFSVGVNQAMGVSAADINSAIRAPLEGGSSTSITNNHAEAGAQEITVLLMLDGEIIARKIVRTVRDNPQEVAAAAEEGTTKLARRR